MFTGSSTAAAPAYTLADGGGGIYSLGSGTVGISAGGVFNGVFGYNAVGGLSVPSTGGLFFLPGASAGTPDIGFSRGAVGKVYVGNGTAGDYTGTLIAGNVGIGTTGPSAKLEISGGNILLDNNQSLRFKNSSGTEINVVTLNSSDVASFGYSTAAFKATTASFPYLDIQAPTTATAGRYVRVAPASAYTTSTGNAILFSIEPSLNQSGTAGYTGLQVNATETATGSGSKFLADFQTGGASKFVVTSAGNVGIGTTAPGEKLEVAGNIKFNASSQKLIFGNNQEVAYNSGIDGPILNGYGGSGLAYQGTVGLRLTNTGNVGIGTTAPAELLQVLGGSIRFGTNTAGRLRHDSGVNVSIFENMDGAVGLRSSWGGYLIENISDTAVRIGTTSSIPIIFNPGGSETVRFTNTGNVGIGTTAPTNKLDVVGIIAAKSSSTNNYFSINPGTTNGPYLHFDNASAGDWDIFDDGGDLRFDSSSSTRFLLTQAGALSSIASLSLSGAISGGTTYSGSGNITSTAGVLTISGTGNSSIAGNVGIGTTGPGAKLDILGAGKLFNMSPTVTTAAFYGMLESDGTHRSIIGQDNSAGTGLLLTGGAPYAMEIGTLDPFPVILATNNAERVRITSDGNVGIGTTGPAFALDVNSYSASIGSVDFSMVGSHAGILSRWVGLILGRTQASSGDPSGYLSLQRAEDGGAIVTGMPLTMSGGNIVLNGNWLSGDGGNEGIYVNSTGNVGIGTVSPLSKLGILGNASIGATYGAIAAPTSGLIIEGNVGIGTTGPGAKLEVAGTTRMSYSPTQYFDLNPVTEATLRFSATTNPGYFQFYDGARAYTIEMYNATTKNVQIASNAVSYFNGGNVGIGTTGPGAKLDILGDLRIQGTGNPTTMTIGNTASNGVLNFPASAVINLDSTNVYSDVTALHINKNTNTLGGTNLVTIQESGNVGIGTTAPGSVAPGTASPAYSAGKTLEINGATLDPGIFLRDTAGTVGIDIWSDTSGGHGYFDSRFDGAAIRSFNFRTRTAGTPIDAMTILGSGNVGIGTTGPAYLLDIVKSAGSGNGIALGYDGNSANAFSVTNSLIKVPGTLSINGPSILTFNSASGWGGVVSSLKLLGSTASDLRIALIDDNGQEPFSTTIRTTGAGKTTLTTFNAAITPLVVKGASSQTADLLQVQNSSGTGLVVINSSGNVGIGTTGPLTKLSIVVGGTEDSVSNANMALVDSANASDNNYLSIQSGTTGTAGVTFGDSGDGDIASVKFLNTGTSATERLSLYNHGEVVSILGNGNVGIGTTGPGAKLQVNADASGIGQIIRANATTPGNIQEWQNSGGTALSRVASNGDLFVSRGGYYMQLSGDTTSSIGTSNGSIEIYPGGTFNSIFKQSVGLGVGTNSPSARIHSLATTEQLRLGYDTSNYNSFTVGSTGSLNIAAVGTNPNITLTPGGTGYTIINGNVGIGTTGPQRTLQVAGSGIAVTNAYTAVTGLNGLHFGFSTAGQIFAIQEGTAWRNLQIDGSNLLLQTNSTGNVGIGTTGPSRKLEVNGNIRMGALITGAGSAVAVYRDVNGDLADSTSSIRYKDNIVTYEDILPKLEQLRTVRFDWNSQTSTPGMRDFGMIAEEVNSIFPELVNYEADGVTPRGLKYEKMGLFALKGVQELNTLITAQQLQISSLTNVLSVSSNGTVTMSGNVGTGTGTGKIHLEGQCVTGDTMLPIRRRKKKSGEGDEEEKDGDDAMSAGDALNGQGNIGTGTWDYFDCRIDEVREGDEVLSMDEGQVTTATSASKSALGYARINALMDMDIKEVYEITTRSGRKIRTTSAHPYLVLEEV